MKDNFYIRYIGYYIWARFLLVAVTGITQDIVSSLIGIDLEIPDIFWVFYNELLLVIAVYFVASAFAKKNKAPPEKSLAMSFAAAIILIGFLYVESLRWIAGSAVQQLGDYPSLIYSYSNGRSYLSLDELKARPLDYYLLTSLWMVVRYFIVSWWFIKSAQISLALSEKFKKKSEA